MSAAPIPLKAPVPIAIEVRDLRLDIQGQSILGGVNLRVPQGELVALIGPNGSGKTTLLRCILGLERNWKGEIRIFGKERLEEVFPGSVMCLNGSTWNAASS